jgi:hypothetical protein
MVLEVKELSKSASVINYMLFKVDINLHKLRFYNLDRGVGPPGFSGLLLRPQSYMGS